MPGGSHIMFHPNLDQERSQCVVVQHWPPVVRLCNSRIWQRSYARSAASSSSAAPTQHKHTRWFQMLQPNFHTNKKILTVSTKIQWFTVFSNSHSRTCFGIEVLFFWPVRPVNRFQERHPFNLNVKQLCRLETRSGCRYLNLFSCVWCLIGFVNVERYDHIIIIVITMSLFFHVQEQNNVYKNCSWLWEWQTSIHTSHQTAFLFVWR